MELVPLNEGFKDSVKSFLGGMNKKVISLVSKIKVTASHKENLSSDEKRKLVEATNKVKAVQSSSRELDSLLKQMNDTSSGLDKMHATVKSKVKDIRDNYSDSSKIMRSF